MSSGRKLLRGSYRGYFHLGSIGIKFAIPSGKGHSNKLANFFTGCAMNCLERNRYLYYCKRKPFIQWGRKWKYSGPDIALNPTWLSFFGLFNVVRHCKPLPDRFTEKVKVLYKGKWLSFNDPELPNDLWNYSQTSYYLFKSIVEFNSSSESNLAIYKGKLYAIDYGDFNIDRHNQLRVNYIDYK